MKRILQVFASLDRGGAEMMIMNLYRKIDKNQVQFDFVVNSREKQYHFEDEIISLGGEIIKAPTYKFFNHNSYIDFWKSLLCTKKWSVIHIHHTIISKVIINLAKKYQIPIIVHSHTSGGGGDIKSTLKKILRKGIYEQADYAFACSKSAAKWMFGTTENVVIINNSVDTNEFKYSESNRINYRNQLKISDKFVVGHVGRFDDNKNHEFLIDIFKCINNTTDSVLLLIGQGSTFTKIVLKVKEYGLEDKVIFLGVRDDISNLMQTMDLFILPSKYEGLPVTVIEAQACGVPSLISDSITEEVILTDLVKRYSLQNSAEEWAVKSIEFANKDFSRDTTQRIIDNGYDIKNNTKLLQKFYLSIL